MASRTAGLWLGAVALAVVLGAAWILRNGGLAPASGPASVTAAADAPRPGAPSPASGAAADTSERERVVLPDAPAERAADAAAADPAAAPVVATVRGRVLDTRGNAVADATVARLSTDAPPLLRGLPAALRSDGGTKTAADGRFALGLPALGPFTLRVSHAEHPPAEHRGTAPLAAGEDLVITLRDGATITGRVVGVPADAGPITVSARAIETAVESLTQEPLGGLLDIGSLLEDLDLANGDASDTAGADDTFELRGLDPDRRYRLAATHQPADVVMPQRCAASVEVGAGARGVQLVWREPFVIVARVFDADTGRPIETLDVAAGPVQEMKLFGQTVPVPMLMPRPEHEYANGLVEVRGMAVDPQKALRFGLQIAAAGRRTWSRDDLVPPSSGRLDLGTIQLAPAPIVHVTVMHRGRPLPGAEVRLESVDPPADGSEPQMQHSIRFSTRTTGRTSAAGQAFAESQQELQRDRSVTAADGTCELTADQLGTARLIVTAKEFAPNRGEPFVLPQRGTIRQAVELLVGATAMVRAVDGHDQPLGGAQIRREGPGEEADARATDASGGVRFEHLAPGEHTFAIEARESGGGSGIRIEVDGRERSQDTTRAVVALADAEVRDVLLREPLRGLLHGTVTLDGEPLERATVRLAPADASDSEVAAAAIDAAVASTIGSLFGGAGDQSATTDDDGRYELRDVPAGQFRLVVGHRRLAMDAGVACRVGEGDNRQDVALRLTVVRGRVVGADGQPIASASVTAEPWSNQVSAQLNAATDTLREMFGGGARRGVRTDGDGNFELAGVQVGEPLRLRASAAMCIAGSARIDALADGETRSGVELRLQPAGRVRVRAPVAGAVAVVAEWAGAAPAPDGAHQRTQVLKNGRATLDGLPPGRWQLRLDGTDAAKQHAATIDVVAGQTLDAEL